MERELKNQRTPTELLEYLIKNEQEFIASFLRHLYTTVADRIQKHGQGEGPAPGPGPQLLDCLARLLTGEDKCAAVFFAFDKHRPNAPLFLARNYLDFCSTVSIDHASVSFPDNPKEEALEFHFNGITFSPSETKPYWSSNGKEYLRFQLAFRVNVLDGKKQADRIRRANLKALEVFEAVEFAANNYGKLLGVISDNRNESPLFVTHEYSNIEGYQHKALISMPLGLGNSPGGHQPELPFSLSPFIRGLCYLRLLGHELVKAADEARAKQVAIDECLPPYMRTHALWPFILSESLSFEFLNPENRFGLPTRDLDIATLTCNFKIK